MANATCPKETAEEGPSLFQNGNLVIQTHHIGWIVTGIFTIIATTVSCWLVNKHLCWYTNKREQRYIVRLLFMVPIYAIISFASYLFWNHSTPLLLIRDGYESTVLTAFFYLLLMYISPNPDEQKLIFLKVGLSREADMVAIGRGEPLKKWCFPLNFVKWKPADGSYFLQLMKWGVLQYCVIRPTTTLASVILDHVGLYCEESWSPRWGHLYITIIVSLSVTLAMYCLIQLYITIASDLASHKPLLKLFAIKAVVFLTFWQATLLSVLSMFGVVNDTRYMTAADINIGIGALLETFEMMIFACIHLRAFTYKPYSILHGSKTSGNPAKSTPRLRSLGHAMDFRETFREIWMGCKYIFDKLCNNEPRQDINAKRTSHYEGVFGRSRPLHSLGTNGLTRQEHLAPTFVAVEVEVEKHVDVDIKGERQWLGVGDDYAYGLGYMRREKSDGLGEQIERELEKHGYNGHTYSEVQTRSPPDTNNHGHRSQQPWWRSVYYRISQSGADHSVDSDRLMVKIPSKPSRRYSRPGYRDQCQLFESQDIDDPPPQSIMETYLRQHPNVRQSTTDSRTPSSIPPTTTPSAPLDRQSFRIAHPVPGPSYNLSHAESLRQHISPQVKSNSTQRDSLTSDITQPIVSSPVDGQFPLSTYHKAVISLNEGGRSTHRAFTSHSFTLDEERPAVGLLRNTHRRESAGHSYVYPNVSQSNPENASSIPSSPPQALNRATNRALTKSSSSRDANDHQYSTSQTNHAHTNYDLDRVSQYLYLPAVKRTSHHTHAWGGSFGIHDVPPPSQHETDRPGIPQKTYN